MVRTPVSSGRSMSLAIERVRRLGRERHALHDIELALAVDRVAEAVEHAAEQAGPHVHAEGAAERLYAAAGVQALHFAERHEQHAALVEAHHLGEHGAVARVTGHAAERAESGVEPGGLEHETDHAHDTAVGGEGRAHACTWPSAR
jgi:hypothetical protein